MTGLWVKCGADGATKVADDIKYNLETAFYAGAANALRAIIMADRKSFEMGEITSLNIIRRVVALHNEAVRHVWGDDAPCLIPEAEASSP
jgi:hypothetical protein